MSIDQLLHSTLRIEMGATETLGSSGTGFLFGFLRSGKFFTPAIVTNRHVVDGHDFAAFHITGTKADGSPDYENHERIIVKDFQNNCIMHPNPDVDLAIMPCGAFLNAQKSRNFQPFITMLDDKMLPTHQNIDDFTALEEIIMIGYPTGLWDSTNNLPIVRRGSTATPLSIDYEGKKEFVVDIACFPGSSGSPVFLHDPNGYSDRHGNLFLGASRTILVGILWGGPVYAVTGEIVARDIPTSAQPIAISRTMMNLGFCIKSELLLEFEPLLRQKLHETQNQEGVES